MHNVLVQYQLSADISDFVNLLMSIDIIIDIGRFYYWKYIEDDSKG